MGRSAQHGLLIALGFLLAACSPGLARGSLTGPGDIGWQKVIAGLENPTSVATDPRGELYVLERRGLALRIDPRTDEARTFLDLRPRVTWEAGEQGLLGLAFHPDYPDRPAVFVNYTGPDGHSFISRFTVDGPSGRADAASERILLRIEQPYDNHNGGGMAFGPDGYLYIGSGDGGSRGDPHNLAQSLDTVLGKLLRIDVDAGEFYAVPPDNPFVGQEDARPEIWAYGLRNPWRFSFDSASGDLYLADVGQSAWEEINFEPAGSGGGRNYGWNLREGMHEYRQGRQRREMIDPVAEYSHELGCAVAGGVVVRTPALPQLDGVYLYGDACSGRIWGLSRNEAGEWRTRELFDTAFRITDFASNEQGVYVLDYREQGALYRLAPDR